MTYIIFHGSFGSPEENWFPYLKAELERKGEKVFIPKFPVDDWDLVSSVGENYAFENQSLSNWMDKFEAFWSDFDGTDELCFVGHSLGCLFILHVLEKLNVKIDSAIFVSPFLEHLGCDWQIDLANKTFYKTDFDFEKIKAQIGKSYSIFSDNDPYVEQHFAKEFADKIGSSEIIVNGAGHMGGNTIEFPLLLNLCLTRVNYEKYNSKN